MTERTIGRIPSRLPLGAVVCIADLVDVLPAASAVLDTNAIERLYGDYTPGRWAWHLTNIRVLAEPYGVKGKQGLWEWPVSIDALKFEGN